MVDKGDNSFFVRSWVMATSLRKLGCLLLSFHSKWMNVILIPKCRNRYLNRGRVGGLREVLRVGLERGKNKQEADGDEEGKD